MTTKIRASNKENQGIIQWKPIHLYVTFVVNVIVMPSVRHLEQTDHRRRRPIARSWVIPCSDGWAINSRKAYQTVLGGLQTKRSQRNNQHCRQEVMIDEVPPGYQIFLIFNIFRIHVFLNLAWIPRSWKKQKNKNTKKKTKKQKGSK